MPTTDPDYARRAVEALGESGVPFAVLHSKRSLIEGKVASDVDIVSGIEPLELITACSTRWREHGLLPVMVWPYDIGGTATIFLSTPRAEDGVQLDVLYDPAGTGRYGLRSTPLVDSADQTDPVPGLAAPFELIYLWRKRQLKSQPEELRELRRRAAELPFSELEAASLSVTGSVSIARSLRDGESRPLPKPPHPMARTARITRRLRKPIGVWAHAHNPDVARDLADRLAGFLIVVRSEKRKSGALASTVQYSTRIVPTIIRPGAFLSTGTAGGTFPRPEVTLAGASADDAAEELVAFMAARARP